MMESSARKKKERTKKELNAELTEQGKNEAQSQSGSLFISLAVRQSIKDFNKLETPDARRDARSAKNSK